MLEKSWAQAFSNHIFTRINEHIFAPLYSEKMASSCYCRGNRYRLCFPQFAPKLDIAEDPVCGSGHCHIVPYWAGLPGKDKLVAYQASKRGGTLYCRREGNKIFMAGKAALYSVDELFLG